MHYTPVIKSATNNVIYIYAHDSTRKQLTPQLTRLVLKSDGLPCHGIFWSRLCRCAEISIWNHAESQNMHLLFAANMLTHFLE